MVYRENHYKLILLKLLDIHPFWQLHLVVVVDAVVIAIQIVDHFVHQTLLFPATFLFHVSLLVHATIFQAFLTFFSGPITHPLVHTSLQTSHSVPVVLINIEGLQFIKHFLRLKGAIYPFKVSNPNILSSLHISCISVDAVESVHLVVTMGEIPVISHAARLGIRVFVLEVKPLPPLPRAGFDTTVPLALFDTNGSMSEVGDRDACRKATVISVPTPRIEILTTTPVLEFPDPRVLAVFFDVALFTDVLHILDVTVVCHPPSRVSITVLYFIHDHPIKAHMTEGAVHHTESFMPSGKHSIVTNTELEVYTGASCPPSPLHVVQLTAVVP